MINLQLTPPLPPMPPDLMVPMLLPKLVAPPTPISHIHWEIENLLPTPLTPWKTRKRRKLKFIIKLQSTPNPVPKAPGSDTPNSYSQDDGSTDFNSPYSLRNRKFAPYCTTAMKNQRKRENKIDNKDIFEPPPDPWCTWSWYTQCFLPRW